MDVAGELAGHRDFLVAVAYRMLGSRQAAEDVVQEAFVRADRARQAGGDDAGDIAEPRAWLTRIVSRLALDELKSARAQRERYVGSWLPEPVVESAAAAAPGPAGPPDPADRVTLYEQVSLALLTVLETLSPAERAVYVLHEAFAIPFDEVAEIVGRTPAACRQLAARARRHIEEHAPRFDPEPRQHARVVRAFQAAVEGGDIDALAELLDDQVTLTADGGGVVRTALRPVSGRSAVVKALASGLRSVTGVELQEVSVNGQPGLLARYDGGTAVFAFLVAEGRITQIDLVANPEKLRRAGDPRHTGEGL